MLNLIELIKKLPNELQNKLFYFITIHPIAYAFKLDYKNLENTLTKDNFDSFKNKYRRFYNFNNTNSLKYYYLWENWSDDDLKPFIIVNKIRIRKKNNIYDNILNYYKLYYQCLECYNTNKYYIECIKCRKRIKYINFYYSKYIISYQLNI